MTARIKALTVALDHDIREDDIEPLVNAILHMKGVTTVTTRVATSDDWLARIRVQGELRKKLWDVLNEKETP